MDRGVGLRGLETIDLEPVVIEMSRAPRRRSAPSEVLVEMARLKGLSDSVVAFALTLLVLDIRLPPGVTTADLPGSVFAMGPAMLVYLLSFAIIGGAWGSHQRMLGQISRGDGLLVWFNLLSLLPVTLLPACASLLGDFPNQDISIAVFALDALAIQLTAFLLWRHASRHGLVHRSLDPRVVDGIGRRLLVSASGFALSIPLALVNPTLAYALWVAVFALVFTTDWLSWQQATRTTVEEVDLDGATSARVRIRHSDGKLHVDALDDERTVLVDGVFGGGLGSTVVHEGGRVDVGLTMPRVSGLLNPRYPWAWGHFSADWDLGLSDRVPLALTVETMGGTADLDLEDIKLTRLDVRANASAAEITLPADAGHCTVAVTSIAASVVVHVPDGVAAWIRGDKDMPELELDMARFPAAVVGREYRSANYDSSPNRVELSASLRAGFLKVV